MGKKEKSLDRSKAEYLTLDEGLYVHILHIGLYDEPTFIALLVSFINENGYKNDFFTDSPPP